MAPQTIESVAIVGGGFMGSGIAETVARAGIPVQVHEPTGTAQERIEKSVGVAVNRGKMSAEDAEELYGLISYPTSIEEIAPADLAVEAVTEDVDVKQKVFEGLDAVMPDHALLASNTSSIPIAELACLTKRPDRVLGLHFFSPVPVMPLVEIVCSLDTSDDCHAAADAFAQAIGKTPVVTKDRSGFIVNMLLVPYLMAAVTMYEDGFATREDIDAGMKLGCGHPMGPLALCDLIGLDVLHSVCNSLFDEFKRPEYAPPPLMRRMIAAGRLGRKTGRGFYDYD
jgi:3-hydroxybutyryl-CoA dehydrogenase